MTLPVWLDDIGTYLQTEGMGTLGTDIFYHGFDSLTSNCISLSGSAGPGADTTLAGDMILYKPELGVLVRNASDTSANSKALSIYNLLNLKTNFTSGTTRFKRIRAISEPFFVSKTANNLYIYSINFEIQISGA